MDNNLGAALPGRDAPAAAACLLDALPLRRPARVVSITAPAEMPEWQSWLAEIGFLPGEQVTILARGRPGDDPLVVRIGDSTFALRRAEAACIEVDAAAADEHRGA
jgi:ferrous iron transport protein A